MTAAAGDEGGDDSCLMVCVCVASTMCAYVCARECVRVCVWVSTSRPWTGEGGAAKSWEGLLYCTDLGRGS